MTDQEKFEGFKERIVDNNEDKYGKEIRGKYGDGTIDKTNAKVKGMTEAQCEEVSNLEQHVLESLKAAMETGDPAGELAQKTADLHRQWLSFYWSQYSKEAHAGLTGMYVADERFTAYYDKIHSGAALFLRDAVLIYTKN